jgi:Carbohydrate-selective porin, OprB family
MSKVLRQLLLALPAAYAASLFAAAGAFAAPATQPQAATDAADLGASARLEITAASTNFDASAQSADLAVPAAAPVVANSAIDTATTIQPTDWQYDALRGVQSKYDCNSATLNGQPVSRDSFAAGLNTCLKNVEPLMARTPSTVSAQEMEVLRRLTQDFRAELSNIETRIDKIQQRTALAQTSQFSTTTKLKGEVIMGLNGVISGGGPGSNATLSNRARLLFESTFTGKDRLYTRITANNGGGYGRFKNDPAAGVISASEANQTYFGGGNAVNLDWLAYQFPLGNTSVYAAAYNGIHSDYADTHSPYLQDYTGGNGAISLLAEENPIYKVGGGTGVGVTIPLNNANVGLGLDSLNLSYFAGTTANSPANGNGIFAGRNSFLAQVNFKPSDKFDLGLAYVNAYHNGGGIYDFGGGGAVVGSAFTGPLVGYNTSNSYGLSASYKASDNFNLNGYITKTSATTTANTNADILTYGIGAAFPNVGQPGNLLGFFVGQAPTVTNSNLLASSAYHIEGFYKYKLNDNISVTPGLIYLTNPNQVLNNSTGALIGTVRTTFTF